MTSQSQSSDAKPPGQPGAVAATPSSPTSTAAAVALEEWKQRYDSYRQYRTQYMTVTSVVFVGVFAGTGTFLGKDMPTTGRCVGLALVAVISISFVVAHYVAIRAVRDLGTRLNDLERQVGMQPFKTTWLLETALAFTRVGSYLLAACQVGLFIVAVVSPATLAPPAKDTPVIGTPSQATTK